MIYLKQNINKLEVKQIIKKKIPITHSLSLDLIRFKC